MQAEEKKSILIIGGYGRAGHNIARLLLQEAIYDKILIAGRNLEKAQKVRQELKKTFPEAQVQGKAVDLYQKESVLKVLPEVSLVVVCMPLDEQAAEYITSAVLQFPQLHYIDLTPGTEKEKVWQHHHSFIKSGRHLFIRDAGFEPGLPGFLTHCLMSGSTKPRELSIAGVYRDREIPNAGIQDILNHGSTGSIYKEGKWRKAGMNKMKNIRFAEGFGKILCLPISAAELEKVPETHSLEKLQYYHGGINSVSNMVLFYWQYILRYFLPLHIGVQLFRWAIRKFTAKPLGGIIQAELKGEEGISNMSIYHPRLYEATAIPVVATISQLLKAEPAEGGCFFMGEWVKKEDFVRDLKKMGMHIKRA